MHCVFNVFAPDTPVVPVTPNPVGPAIGNRDLWSLSDIR